MSMKIQYYTIYSSIGQKYLYIDEHGYVSLTPDVYRANMFTSVNEAFKFFQERKSTFHCNSDADYHVIAVWTVFTTSMDKLKTKSEVMREKYKNKEITSIEYITFLENNQKVDRTLYEG